jgi:hypothetical protein
MKHYISPDNKLFAFELDGSQDHLIPSSYVQVTDEQAQTHRELQQNIEFESMSYAEKRKAEYPSIYEQLDALYHAGVFPEELAQKIKEVKEKYPK